MAALENMYLRPVNLYFLPCPEGRQERPE